MLNKKTVFRDLRSIEREKVDEIAAELDGDDTIVFTSPEIIDFVNEEVKQLTGRRQNSAIRVHIAYDPTDSNIGFTTNDTIVVNAGHKFVSGYTKLADKIMAVWGILYHEIAHCLYLDFDKDRAYMKAISEGKMLGNLPSVSGLDAARLRAMLQCVADTGKYEQLFLTLYHGFSNVISDEHDERCFIRDHSSYHEQCIEKDKAHLGMGVNTYEKWMEEIKKNEDVATTAALDMILQQARFGFVYSTKPNVMEQDDFYKEVVVPVKSRLEDVTKDTASFDEIIDCCNELIFHVWKIIAKNQEKKQQQNQNQQNQQGQQGSQGSSGQGSGNQSQNQQGSSGSQSGSQSGNQSQNGGSQNSGNQNGQKNGQNGNGSSGLNMTEQQLNELISQLQSEINKMTGSKPQLSEKAQKQCQAAGKNANSGGQQNGQDAEAEAIAEAIAKAITQRIVEAQAGNAVAQVASNELIMLAKGVGVTSTHKGVPLNVRRKLDIASQGKQAYNRITKEQESTLKVMIKRMQTAFKDMQVGAVKKHQIMGNSFVASDAYRLDGCAFSNKKNRKNEPDIAVTVLVDESGSMYGPRIQAAQKTAVLLYNFCRTLKIPCMVCGHQTGCGTNFNIYSDFRPVKDDQYRVAAGISDSFTGGCNRDGHALQVAGGLLMQRSEPVRLLMIVSDGQPNDNDYRGKAAERDIQETVRSMSRKGVSTIAFAIGSDKENIKEIYGERYVDISDLNEMPKVLCKIVAREVLKSVNK